MYEPIEAKENIINHVDTMSKDYENLHGWYLRPIADLAKQHPEGRVLNIHSITLFNDAQVKEACENHRFLRGPHGNMRGIIETGHKCVEFRFYDTHNMLKQSWRLQVGNPIPEDLKKTLLLFFESPNEIEVTL